MQESKESSGAIAKEEWKPLQAFYEPTQDTIDACRNEGIDILSSLAKYNSWLSVGLAIVLGGGALLVVQGLNAEYFILVFVLVVIAFGFVVALLGLKAITPEKESTDDA
eukprot:g18358.t1